MKTIIRGSFIAFLALAILALPTLAWSGSVDEEESCRGWSLSASSDPEGAVVDYSPAQSGDWSQGRDSVDYVVTFTWYNPDGSVADTDTVEGTVNKPEDCDPTPTPPPPIVLHNDCRGWALTQGDVRLDGGQWSDPFALEIATSQYVDYVIREPEECLRPTPTPTTEPITLEVSCAGWRVKQGGQTIEGAAWEDPFSLEVHFSEVLKQRIHEPEECLKQRGDPTLRIGGRCTEDGDSQEIGYVFDDGDFDGARLIITRQDGVEVANVGEGSDFFPARAAGYSWKIMWFDGEKRVELDAGRFEVPKCDLPTPTPEPTDKPEPTATPKTPPTGGSGPSNGDGLLYAFGLSGLAAVGLGAYKLWERRRVA